MWINLSETQVKWLRGAVIDEEIVKVFGEALASEGNPEVEYYRELAGVQAANDEVSIDDDAVVSFGENENEVVDGAYVMAWVWVEDDRTTCRDCGVKFEEGGDNDTAGELCADCADCADCAGKKASEDEGEE
jgi:hypothetical protein